MPTTNRINVVLTFTTVNDLFQRW